LDLPFPPRALRASYPVRRVAALEHEALGALLARLRAGDGERLPGGRAHLRGGVEARASGNRVHHVVEARAALLERALAPVLARELEQVEGEEDHGRIGHHLLA